MLLSFALIVALSLNNAPTWLIVMAYLVNWPYSGFILVAVWRASATSKPLHREITRAIALLWLIFALIV
ncbi:hypothetical protein GCM10011499_24650 [Pelagibacterium lentulum]|uniref:Uncharacterized protein n=2 Tax=Pelagibacterium lentulum TaxID=2029865 RepID=A0A916VYM5_9HYPH|nr:hypothetical protein GCM10011499_24650 [Pelagibacterium lentulum]